MSNTRLHSDQDTVHHSKESNHRRNNSGELDVFEAAGYFSGSTEYSTFSGAIVTQKGMSNTTEQRKVTTFGGVRRMSLDMPTRVINQLPTRSPRIEKQIKDKKYRQPSSPGAKLASFLNSLFNQASSKKKNSSKPTLIQSMKDEEESPGGRRKRRSSISHLPSFSTTKTDPKSVFYYSSASSVSDIRTPPLSVSTTTTPKLNKNLRGDSDHHQQREMNFSFKHKAENGYSGKNKKLCERDSISVKAEISGSTENKKKKEDMISSRRVADYAFEVDEGGESDSSSDLFELQNYDFASVYTSKDLPVYETTHMESYINRGAPISNGPL